MENGAREDPPATTRPMRAAAPASPTRFVRDLAALVGSDGRDALRAWTGAMATRIADAARRDLDDGLALPGLVVVFACGIALYFALPREPWLPATLAFAVGAVGFTSWRRRHGATARVAAMVAAVALGMAAAGVETWRVAAPRLDHERTVSVAGRVTDVDATAKGGLRLTVAVAAMEGRGLTPETTPAVVTATQTTRGYRPTVGDGVRFKARLKPPEGPVLPGAYDFARRAWYERRGASGYVLGRVEPFDLGPPPAATRAFAAIGVLRHAIAERVRASLPGADGTIAAAIMVGEQRAIPDDTNDALRASGLTHIVSISGLHMSLVAGGVIVAIRMGLALIPFLALGFPIKKWAAAAAFLAATVYLLLSGNQVAALRSHLMLSVALLAVLVDRPAITMHTIAVSAALILAWDPASALEPSFLMSYLAVIALVASYDLYRLWSERRPPPQRDAGMVAHAIGSGLRHIEGLALSSLIAGLATAPVIAGVFFRGAPYSIIANMIVLPVTGMVIMPAAVVAALAMPFGLDHWPLQVMGLGIDFMILIGRWAAGLPGGAGLIGAPHAAMMPLGIAAVLWLSLWKSRIRLFGLLPALAAVALVVMGPRPDVMVGRHGAPVAVRDAAGRLHVLASRQEGFDTAIWLAADADARLAGDPRLADGWRCDSLGCVFRLPGQVGGDGEGEPAPADPDADLVVAVVRHPQAFAEDCRRATLVVSQLVAPAGCRDHTTVIDRTDLAHGGASTLDFVGPITRPIAGRSMDPAAGGRDVSSRSGGSPGVADPTRDGAEEAPSAGDGAADTRRGDVALDSVGRGDAAVAAALGGAGDVVAAEDDQPTWPRRALVVTTSLPRFARPWTPIDPTVVRIEAEAAAGTAAAAKEPAEEPEPDGAPAPEAPP